MNVRRLLLTLLIVLISASLMAQGPAQAQRGQAQRPRLYDPSTETTLKGTVDRVQQFARKSAGLGTQVILKTEKETIDVRLGPSPFLAKHKLALAKGDPIEVTGSRVKVNGKEVLIAREVKKDGKVVTLRDAQGVPEWSRARRRPS